MQYLCMVDKNLISKPFNLQWFIGLANSVIQTTLLSARTIILSCVNLKLWGKIEKQKIVRIKASKEVI